MSESPSIPPSPSACDPAKPAPRSRTAALLTALLALLLLLLAAGWYAYYPSRIGPAQPVSFSHRLHAGDKRISCLFCHDSALESPHASVPPLQTCMLCHEHIIITHPEVAKIREHWAAGKPIPWVRVNQVPDFVFFNHSLHLRKGVDCGRCHGDVAAMDRVALPHDLTMGFCVQCHRDNKVSHDCYICHR